MMELAARLTSNLGMNGFRRRQAAAALNAPSEVTVPWREHYAVLRAYAANNSLYDRLAQAAYESSLWQEALKSIRNPAFRLIEYYSCHLWPGSLDEALPIVSDNKAIVEPIQQLWDWSNWAAQKQRAARWLARDGDLFVKVVGRQADGGKMDRVYFQLLDAACVSDFDTDERGFVTWMRMDVPQVERLLDGKVRRRTLTEVWDKDTQTFRRWLHEQGLDIDLGQLGTPLEERPFSDFGISFVPIVWVPFRDAGDARGQAAIMPLIDKIDEANRKATRLSQMLFRHNKATWAVQGGGNDASGRPLPAPQLANRADNGNGTGRATMADSEIQYIPGSAQLVPLVPNLDYDAYLKVLQDDMRELEQDAPELLYYRMTELGTQISGRALRFLHAPAIKRVEEVRGNAFAGLVRLDMMGLTMAAAAGLTGFTSLGGTFEDGKFEHHFDAPPVLPVSEQEEAETQLIKQQVGVTRERSLLELGYSPDDITEMSQQRDAQAQQTAALGDAMLRNFDAGRNGAPQ
jgi:hypothetical protein